MASLSDFVFTFFQPPLQNSMSGDTAQMATEDISNDRINQVDNVNASLDKPHNTIGCEVSEYIIVP